MESLTPKPENSHIRSREEVEQMNFDAEQEAQHRKMIERLGGVAMSDSGEQPETNIDDISRRLDG